MRAIIERVTPDRVSGWAVNDQVFGERLTVSLYREGSLVAEMQAANYRDDLKRNDVGDGRYGFIFAFENDEALPKDFLEGSVQVRARNEAGVEVLARPADYLERELKHVLLLRNLEAKTFDAVVEDISASSYSTPEDACFLLNLLNASRAHFPDWSRSARFLDLAIKLAQAAETPHTLRYYRLLARRQSGSVDGHDSMGWHEASPGAPTTYATAADLNAEPSPISIRIERPNWAFGGGHNVSFLEEVGLLKADADASEAVPVLAFREYAFGEPTWYVKQHGALRASPRNLYYLDFEQVRRLLDNGGVLIIDMSNEGPRAYPDWVELLNKALRELNIPSRQTLFVVQNLNFGCEAGAPVVMANIEYAHYFICSGIQVLKKEFPSDSQIGEHCNNILLKRKYAEIEDLKHYICMNFTPRWHRWAVVLHLSLHRLLGKGFVSFPGKANFKMTEFTDLDEFFPALVERDDLIRHVPEFLSKCPLILDVDSSTRETPNYEFPLKLLTRSMVHFVTESEVTDGSGVRRVTEKILKPIVGLQPFLIIGNPGSLQLLREMGFRTFPALINEAYDDILDPAERLDFIYAEINRIVSLPINELRSLVETQNEAVVHNFNHLMNGGKLLFCDAVAGRLRKAIFRMTASLRV